MKNGQIRILSESDVLKLLDMKTVLDNVDNALKENAQGNCINPLKLHMSLSPEIQGYMNSMPAYLKKHHVMGAKLVSVYKQNMVKYKLPVTMATIVLQRPESGMPFAVVAGTNVTSMRTGAVAGVSAKYLAKKNAQIVLQIGAGAQGFMGARAVLTALPKIKELRVADLNEDSLKSFYYKIGKEFPSVKIVLFSDYKKALKGSEVICMATTSSIPLLRGQKLDKGTTVLVIAELMDDDDLNSYDRCILDFPECFVDRINDDLRNWSEKTGLPHTPIQLKTCDASLGEVITGKKVGRVTDDDIIVVGFVGMGIEDVMVAKTAVDRAEERNIGFVLDFGNMQQIADSRK